MKLIQTHIIPYIKQYYRSILLVIFLGILTVAASAMLTFTSGYLISSASLMPVNILMLYVPIVLVRTFGISQAVTRYLERLIGHNSTLKILANMRVQLYQMLEPQALFIRSRFKTGDLLGTLADDIEHLQDVYVRTIFPSVVAFCIFVASILSIAYFDFLFALWMVICLSLILIMYPLLSLYLLKKRQVEQKKIRSNLYSTFTDAVFGIRDWMISGQYASFLHQFNRENRKNIEIERKMHDWNQSREFQMRLLSGVILISIGVWAGGMAQSGRIAPAYIAAFTLVILPIIEGLIPVSRAIERIPTYSESWKRLDQIQKFIPISSAGIKSTPFPLSKGEIVIHQVSFRYPNKRMDAINELTLHVHQGQKVALLGKSGAGKSTLLQLMIGALTPLEGEIALNGHSPKDWGEGIYSLMGVLNQKPYLFATSLENNIRLGNEDAAKEDIERVIKQVKLDQYIHSLPYGLSTQMEEAGQRFSGGERQRIALARILLKNTPIVVLDEPTVGLDPLTENDLIATIFHALKDKTVIWITHHLIGMEKMDNILFMEKGRMVMKGNHQELLVKNERYRHLYELDCGKI